MLLLIVTKGISKIDYLYLNTSNVTVNPSDSSTVITGITFKYI